MLKRLLKAGFWVFLGILLGRIAGFAREVLLAGRLGTGTQADLAVLVLTLPDILVNLLMGGAVGAALIPEFKRLDPTSAARLYRQALLVFGLGSLALVLVLAWKAAWLIPVFTPGLPLRLHGQAVHLIRISLWALPLTAASAASAAYLQSHHRFAVTAMGAPLYNLVLVAGLALTPASRPLVWTIAGCVPLAALVRWIPQAAQSAGLRGAPAPGVQGAWLLCRSILVRYLQVLLAGGMLFLLPVLGRRLATLDGEGSMAILNYALKLVELPSGVCLSVFALVLLPTLSELLPDPASAEKARDLLRHCLWILVALALPIALAVAWFREAVVRLVFGWGAMGPGALHRVAVLAALGMISLPAQGLHSVTTAALNARRDGRSPFLVSSGAVVIYLVLAGALRPFLGLPALLVALAAVNWGVFLSHILILRLHHGLVLLDPPWFTRAGIMALAATATFLPFAWLGTQVAGARGQVGVAFLGGLVSLLAGLASVPDYRQRGILWLRGRLAPSI